MGRSLQLHRIALLCIACGCHTHTDHSDHSNTNGNPDGASAVDASAADPDFGDLPPVPDLSSMVANADAGSGGPAVNTVSIDPSNPQTVYAGKPNAGLYRSLDGGNTWTRINALGKVTVDPQQPQTLYFAPIASDPRPLLIPSSTAPSQKSIDGGSNWTALRGPGGAIYPNNWTGRFGPFAINPANSQELFEAFQYGCHVYVSSDGGQSWQTKATPVICPDVNDPGPLPLSEIPLLTVRGGTLFILGGVQDILQKALSLYQSTDHGDHWTTLCTNCVEDVVYDLVVDPFNSDRVFVVSDGTYPNWGIALSPDRGQSWEYPDFLVQVHPPAQMIPVLGQEGTFYYVARKTAVFDAGRYASVMKGTGVSAGSGSWAVSLRAGDCYDLAVEHSGQTVYAACDDGLHKSTDAGGTWTLLPL